ncbi:hypothetical protein BLNAU_3050 [Blattamonas nauphoetae]|uniref:Uncharacterized protein n=1 Tax=Blattamonas nauphoetae TaxID=2049346 RepID=A0ABQ9YDZ7_9EUKA|nr:hypothetical protein BLNAU_3050 [Blattamonas nauphoetae]
MHPLFLRPNDPNTKTVQRKNSEEDGIPRLPHNHFMRQPSPCLQPSHNLALHRTLHNRAPWRVFAPKLSDQSWNAAVMNEAIWKEFLSRKNERKIMLDWQRARAPHPVLRK